MRLGLLLVVGLVLLAGCGGAKQPASRTPAPTPGLVGLDGDLVSIGGGRSLFVNCEGKGEPLVLLEAGLGANAHSWQDVQSDIAKTTRACAYDRAGIGSSVAPPGTRDADDDVTDEQRLLAAMHARPPYVIVGHSYGGLLARLYASRHADDVGGLVLVDAMGRNQTRRMLDVWPKTQVPKMRAFLTQRVRDGVDLRAGEDLAQSVRSLGDVPLVVVTAHRMDDVQAAPPRLRRSLHRLWLTMQDELARMSGDRLHVEALRSNHFVQAFDQQPAVVVRAVRAAIRAARDHASLPDCRRLFRGAGVRCRQ